MAEVASVRLSGWQAAVVGIGILAWAGWGFVRHIQPVPQPAREALVAWLVEDYTQPDLHHRLLGFGTTHRGDDVVTSPQPAAPADTAAVTVEALDAHGWKDFLIAHATVAVRKPDQTVVHAVRYLDLARGPAGAWRVVRENDAWSYWWVLVPAPRNGSSWP
jgi:hypothetical protein